MLSLCNRTSILRLYLICTILQYTNSIRNANFDLYTANIPTQTHPFRDRAISAGVMVGAASAGAYAGFYTYKKMTGKTFIGYPLNRYKILYDSVRELELQYAVLRDQLENMTDGSNKQSKELLATINTENRLIKEKVNTIVKKIKQMDQNLRDITFDTRETIKYSAETTSKHLKADLQDEIERLNSEMKSLRAEISDIVAKQHEDYIEKLKTYTQVVAKTVADAVK